MRSAATQGTVLLLAACSGGVTRARSRPRSRRPIPSGQPVRGGGFRMLRPICDCFRSLSPCGGRRHWPCASRDGPPPRSRERACSARRCSSSAPGAGDGAYGRTTSGGQGCVALKRSRDRQSCRGEGPTPGPGPRADGPRSGSTARSHDGSREVWTTQQAHMRGPPRMRGLGMFRPANVRGAGCHGTPAAHTSGRSARGVRSPTPIADPSGGNGGPMTAGEGRRGIVGALKWESRTRS